MPRNSVAARTIESIIFDPDNRQKAWYYFVELMFWEDFTQETLYISLYAS